MRLAVADPGHWSRAWPAPVVALLLAMAVVFHDPLALQVLRNLVFDQFQRWHPRTVEQTVVKIIDIDDESMRRLGQWPWPRTRVAELVAAVQATGPAAIALDIVFAEPDRTSPRALMQYADLPPDAARLIDSLPDHDAVLARTLAATNVALSFAPTRGSPVDSAEAADPSAAVASKARFVTIGDSPLPYLPEFSGVVTSLPALRQAAPGHGAMTFVPDADGVVRKVPLLLDLGGQLVPSLMAETLRLVTGERNYTVRTSAQGGGIRDVRIGPMTIDTTPQGAVWVHFARARADRYVPAWKLLAGEVPADELAGRIVMVGTSAQGLMDLRFSPLGGVIAGVEVHAQALEQIVTGDRFGRPDWAKSAEWLLMAIGGLLIALVSLSRGAGLSAAAFIGVSALAGVGAWLAYVHLGWLLDATTPTLALLTVFVPTTVVRHLMSERRQRWVRQAFARYVSPNLVDYLIAHPGALELGGQRRRCSFVFADLAGFTTLMESMDPAAAVSVLNVYLDRMIAIAFAHDGTLDRIVGDSVAIVFSTPVEQSDHEQRALTCARAMQKFASDYVDELALKGVAFCRTRIGVHTGEVIVGNFGGSTIFDYRALGDPVNTASRLEGANKYLGTSLCVSAATLAGCPGAVVRPIGRLQLAGRAEPVMAFEPLAEVDEAYEAAYALMAAGAPEASAAFTALAARRPADPLVVLHLARLRDAVAGDLISLSGK